MKCHLQREIISPYSGHAALDEYLGSIHSGFQQLIRLLARLAIGQILFTTIKFAARNLSIMCRLLIPLLLACLHVQAASFDCKKAQAKYEKLICENEELSFLDERLSNIYVALKEDASVEARRKLTIDQIQWLRETRNRCEETTCLKDAYTSRINTLDPIADNHITCEKIRRFPTRTLGFIDLGSGWGSPNEVDYKCPESLDQQQFMRKLLGMAEEIRRDDGPSICWGSIVYAHWRYYQFSLTKAGFAPAWLVQNPTATDANIEWNTVTRASASTPGDIDRGTRTLKYFKQWSEESQSNLVLYRRFTSEFDRVFPTLVILYERKFRLPANDAKIAARRALMMIVERAAGSFPKNDLKPEPELVRLVRNSQSTAQAIRHELTRLPSDAGQYPKDDIYRAMLIALLNNRSPQIISLLGDQLTPDDFSQFGAGGEPLLSFAIGNQQNLEYLLGRKAPVDTPNAFGKTALFYAIGAQKSKSVEVLLQSGADVNHAYLSAKALRPNDEACVFPDLKHTGRTPLMHAAQNSDVQMIKLLVAAGAHLATVDDLGYNALDYATLGKNEGNENYLKSLGLTHSVPAYSSKNEPAK